MISATTPFQTASLSKPVFAVAVLRLCEQGTITLDTELGSVLPKEDLSTEDDLSRVRVRHILTHTSGIQPDPPKGRAARLMFRPGSRFAYSPHAFDYLQRTV